MSTIPKVPTGRRLAPWPSLDPEASTARGDATETFLATAAAIGGKLCRDALWAGDRCAWLGDWIGTFAGGSRDAHMVFGPDLYSGSGGVGLFLAQLAARVEERLFRRTAHGAIERSLDRAELVPTEQRLSLYCGYPGMALAALETDRALGEERYRKRALALLDEVETFPRSEWDVVAGVAGAIPALLCIHHRHGGDERLVEIATELGDHLIGQAHRGEHGWSWGIWPQGTPEARQSGPFGNLLGFSHGASGVGWALAELFASTDEARFAEAAAEAFRWERHFFDESRGNWPDLRDPALLDAPGATEPTFMRAWCHGAPGIALARLRAFQIFGDELYRQEAEIAIATTRQALQPGSEMSQGNYCLCHGRAGNCEPLLMGAQLLEEPEWRLEAEEIGWQGVEEFHAMQLPWPCGTRRNVEMPALLVGLSGIGYFYLRLADSSVPSILVVCQDGGAT